MNRNFQASTYANIYEGVRGVFVWTDDDIWFFAALGHEDDAETWREQLERVRQNSVSDFVEYALETGLGGYNTFSFAKEYQAETPFEAAELVARKHDFALADTSGSGPVDEHAARGGELEATQNRGDPGDEDCVPVVSWDDELIAPYRHTLRVISEALLIANRSSPGAYADVRPAGEWHYNDCFATFFIDPAGARQPYFHLEWFEGAVMIQDSAFDQESLDGWMKARRGTLVAGREVEAEARVLLSSVGLDPGRSGEAGGERFRTWAKIFRVAVELLDRLDERIVKLSPWTLSTSFHGGWGTYYVHLHDRFGRERLGISEEGHFAGSYDDLFGDVSSNVRRSVLTLTIPDAVEATASDLFSQASDR